MQSDNLIKIIVGAIAALVLFTSFLVPIVSGAMAETGEPVTLENTNYYHYSYALTDEPLEFKMTVGESNARTYSFNGEECVQDTFASINLIVSDGVTVSVPRSDNVTAWGYTYRLPDAASETVVYTVNGDSGLLFENGVIYSVAYSTETRTEIGAYTWVIYNNNESGDWVLITQAQVHDFYIKSSSDIIAGGYYKTGELDTYYTYKDGVARGTVEEYTVNAVYDKTLTEGTTDIYTASNFAIEVTDGTDTESFIPYWFFVKETVNGHATSGTIYNLLGILPLILIAGLLLGIVAYTVRARLS